MYRGDVVCIVSTKRHFSEHLADFTVKTCLFRQIFREQLKT